MKECRFGSKGGEVNRGRDESGVIRLVTWNVAGWGKLWAARDFVDECDIALVQETWVEKKRKEVVLKRLDKTFKWWAKAAVRDKPRGRPAGGHLAGI